MDVIGGNRVSSLQFCLFHQGLNFSMKKLLKSSCCTLAVTDNEQTNKRGNKNYTHHYMHNRYITMNVSIRRVSSFKYLLTLIFTPFDLTSSRDILFMSGRVTHRSQLAGLPKSITVIQQGLESRAWVWMWRP